MSEAAEGTSTVPVRVSEPDALLPQGPERFKRLRRCLPEKVNVCVHTEKVLTDV